MRAQRLERSNLAGQPRTKAASSQLASSRMASPRMLPACIVFLISAIAFGIPQLSRGQAPRSPAAASAAAQGSQNSQSPAAASVPASAPQPAAPASTQSEPAAPAPNSQKPDAAPGQATAQPVSPPAKPLQGASAAGSLLPGNQAQTQPGSPQQQIQAECASLLKMANDLKAEVDKTTEDELSVTVVRKASQIEQLAHSVRDEIKPILAGKN